MKNIRYYLYLALLSLSLSGGIYLWTFIGDIIHRQTYFSAKGIASVVVLGLIPLFGSLVREKDKKVKLLPGMKSNYLKQNTKIKLNGNGITKDDIQNIIYGIMINHQMFEKEYEEQNHIEYRTQIGSTDIQGIKITDKNPIIIEVDFNEDNIMICVYKENQYIEFSNKDNEIVLVRIIEELMNMKNGNLTIAST